jgi:hypothetical protein
MWSMADNLLRALAPSREIQVFGSREDPKTRRFPIRRHPELVSGSYFQRCRIKTLKQVQGADAGFEGDGLRFAR